MKIFIIFIIALTALTLSLLALFYVLMDGVNDDRTSNSNQNEMASAVGRKIEENLQIYGQIKKINVSLEGCTLVISKVYDRSCSRNNPLDNLIGTKNIINLSEITSDRREISVDKDPEKIENAFIYWKLNRKSFEKEDESRKNSSTYWMNIEILILMISINQRK